MRDIGSRSSIHARRATFLLFFFRQKEWGFLAKTDRIDAKGAGDLRRKRSSLRLAVKPTEKRGGNSKRSLSDGRQLIGIRTEELNRKKTDFVPRHPKDSIGNNSRGAAKTEIETNRGRDLPSLIQSDDTWKTQAELVDSVTGGGGCHRNHHRLRKLPRTGEKLNRQQIASLVGGRLPSITDSGKPRGSGHPREGRIGGTKASSTWPAAAAVRNPHTAHQPIKRLFY